MNYKITILGDRIYKEIKLGKEFQNGVLIGTSKECQIRFQKQQYDMNFGIRMEYDNGQWAIIATAGVVFTTSGEQFENIHYMVPQDVLTVCSADTGTVLFHIEFAIDFGDKTKDYRRKIDCHEVFDITIGGLQGSTIQIPDAMLSEDYIRLLRRPSGMVLYTSAARYGIYVNGSCRREAEIYVKDLDFISIAGYSFHYKNGDLYTSEAFPLITQLPMEIITLQSNHLQYPRFVRSARQQFEIPEATIDILPPKSKQEEPKRNLLMSMVPMLLSMGMMALLRASMGGNKRYLFLCVGMGSVSIIMAIINYRNEGLQYRKNIVKRENDYNKYIAEQEKRILAARKKEQIISRQQYPTLEEHVQFAEDFDARLFEKLPEHDDYLSIRLGTGTVEARMETSFKSQEYRQVDDPLMDYPEKIHDKYQFIEDMPVMLSLQENTAVAFIGDRNHLYQMAKNVILTLSTEHYYQDLRMFLLLGEEDKDYFAWARWFRNLSEENGMRNIMYDENSKKNVLEYLYFVLSEREKQKKDNIMPTYVVFVYRSEMLGNHPIINYVEKAEQLGFVFLFFEEYVERVNQYVKKKVFLHQDQFMGYIQDVRNGEQIQTFSYPHISMEQAFRTALRLSCVYVDEVSLEANLTKNITLYELFHILNAYDLHIEERWNKSKIYESMAAPIGVKSGNDVVYLDLHEKYHGPHGLVAGTTGSGKSEILQTYILSMATLFHPYEVGFIIIDFKGGGMVNQFRDLPHLNGAITNIDGDEINRSLASIKAELQKRQRLFAQQDVNHIDDYIRCYKEGKAETPLPHLILIVDEFAELKSEQPEFMKELISAARIGRSLGVHLILATQKPAGVVNDQIWSNSKFKLCLKVQNKADSNEVLKSPLAAEIREPGRAYLQVGNNEIFQLFQSAYSGAPIPNSEMGVQKKFKISMVNLSGERQVIFEQKPREDASNISQLDAIVDYIKEYCEQQNIVRLPNICLPALAECIPFTSNGFQKATTDVVIPIGLYDDPENQRQDISELNFTQGHVSVVGSSQHGKTNLLQTVVRALAENYSSDEVHLYICDFASTIMKSFLNLNHVADVIVENEEDKIKLFMQMMVEELERRKTMLSDMGLSSYASYREAGLKDLPQIIIMIDNMGVLRDTYPELENDLIKVSREGVAVGISMIMTALQTNNIGYKYVANISQKIALYCNNSTEYTNVFERCRMKLKAIPGRFLTNHEKQIHEGQIYLAFASEKEIDRVNDIKEFIQEMNGKDTGSGTRRIPVVPDVLTQEIAHEMVPVPSGPYAVPLGMNFETLEVDELLMESFPSLALSGERDMGRISYLTYFVSHLLRNKQKEPVKIHIVDSTLGELKRFASDTEYLAYTQDNLKNLFERVDRELAERLQNKQQNGAMAALKNRPFECIIINHPEAIRLMNENEEYMKLCYDIVSKYLGLRVSIIIADLPNVNLRLERGLLYKFLEKNNNLLIFRQLQEQKYVELTVKEQKKYKKPLSEMDVYLKSGNYFAKYRTPIL